MRRAFPDADPASAYNQFKAGQKAEADARVQRVTDLQARLEALGVPSTQDQKNEVRSQNALPFRFRTRDYSRSLCRRRVKRDLFCSVQKREVQEDLWVEERLASLEPALTAQGLSIAELYRLSSIGDNKIKGVMPSIGLDLKADPLVIAVKRVRKALADEDKAAKEAPQPRYILECRRPLGRLLQPFINEDRLRWDSYTIGKIIHHRLRDVFAPLLGCDEPQPSWRHASCSRI